MTLTAPVMLSSVVIEPTALTLRLVSPFEFAPLKRRFPLLLTKTEPLVKFKVRRPVEVSNGDVVVPAPLLETSEIPKVSLGFKLSPEALSVANPVPGAAAIDGLFVI